MEVSRFATAANQQKKILNSLKAPHSFTPSPFSKQKFDFFHVRRNTYPGRNFFAVIGFESCWKIICVHDITRYYNMERIQDDLVISRD